MESHFDLNQAKKFLENREIQKKEEHERERIALLSIVINSLKDLFSNSDVEVYLVGSITQPYKFHPQSDVDIVLKNFKGDRFEIWTEMETKIKRNVEIILFETSHFQEHVLTKGLKVL